MSNLTPYHDDDLVDSIPKTKNISNISNPLRRRHMGNKKDKAQKFKSLLSEEAKAMISAMLPYKEKIESQKEQAFVLFYNNKVPTPHMRM